MNTQSEHIAPSAGALRASQAITPMFNSHGIIVPGDRYGKAVYENAALIDRETGMPGLLKVAKLVLTLDEALKGGACFTNINTLAATARAAIAKAEGK